MLEGEDGFTLVEGSDPLPNLGLADADSDLRLWAQHDHSLGEALLADLKQREQKRPYHPSDQPHRDAAVVVQEFVNWPTADLEDNIMKQADWALLQAKCSELLSELKYQRTRAEAACAKCEAAAAQSHSHRALFPPDPMSPVAPIGNLLGVPEPKEPQLPLPASPDGGAGFVGPPLPAAAAVEHRKEKPKPKKRSRSPSSEKSPAPPPKRRVRGSACLTCKEKRLKCKRTDPTKPCEYCERANVECKQQPLGRTSKNGVNKKSE